MSSSPLLPFSIQPVPKPGVENGLPGPTQEASRDPEGFERSLEQVQDRSEPSKDRMSGSTKTEADAQPVPDEHVAKDTGADNPTQADNQRYASADEGSNKADHDDGPTGSEDGSADVATSGEPGSDESELANAQLAKQAALDVDDAPSLVELPTTDTETVALVASQAAAGGLVKPQDVRAGTAVVDDPLGEAKALANAIGAGAGAGAGANGTARLDPLALERALLAENGEGLQTELASIDPAVIVAANDAILNKLAPDIKAQVLGGADSAASASVVDAAVPDAPLDPLALDRAVAAEEAVKAGDGKPTQWVNARPVDGNPGLRDLRSLNYEKAYQSLQSRSEGAAANTADLRGFEMELRTNGTDIELLDLRVPRLTENVSPVRPGPTTWTVDSRGDALQARLASTNPSLTTSPQAETLTYSAPLADAESMESMQTRAGEALRFSGAAREQSRVAPSRSGEPLTTTADKADGNEAAADELAPEGDFEGVDNQRSIRRSLRGTPRTAMKSTTPVSQNAHAAAAQSLNQPESAGPANLDAVELSTAALQRARQSKVPEGPLPNLNRVELTIQDPAGKLRIAVEQSESTAREVGVRLEVPEAAMADFDGAESELDEEFERQGMLLSYFEANAENGAEGQEAFEDFEADNANKPNSTEAPPARVHPSAVRSSGTAGRLLSAVA